MMRELQEEEIQEYAAEYVEESLHQGVDDPVEHAVLNKFGEEFKSLATDFFKYVQAIESI